MEEKFDFFIFYGKCSKICLKWLKMCKTYQGKSHFHHFEAFLMLFENLSENNKIAKYVLEYILFSEIFS